MQVNPRQKLTRSWKQDIAALVIVLTYAVLALGAVGVWYVPVANPSGWQLIENQAILLWNEGSLQAYWLDGRRSTPVAGNA